MHLVLELGVVEVIKSQIPSGRAGPYSALLSATVQYTVYKKMSSRLLIIQK